MQLFINKVKKVSPKDGFHEEAIDKTGYIKNLISSGLTGFIGIALGIIGLAVYVYYRGGQTYLNNLSEAFMFGGNPTLGEYCFGLFIEGIASVFMVVFINMQFWRTKNVFRDEA